MVFDLNVSLACFPGCPDAAHETSVPLCSWNIRHGLGKIQYGLGNIRHGLGNTRHGFGNILHGLGEYV